MKPPVFKNYVDWRKNTNNSFQVAKWAKDTFNYKIVIKKDENTEKIRNIDMRDVGDITLGPWSAYSSISGDIGYYFFVEEVDVMAFKLKFF